MFSGKQPDFHWPFDLKFKAMLKRVWCHMWYNDSSINFIVLTNLIEVMILKSRFVFVFGIIYNISIFIQMFCC